MSKLKLAIAFALAVVGPAIAAPKDQVVGSKPFKKLEAQIGTMPQVAPVVTEATGACNSKLIQFVDQAAGVNYNQFGDYRVPLSSSGGILNVGNCRRLYFEIGASSGTGYSLYMGKISGATLSEEFPGSVRTKIQSVEIKGPEIAFYLRGTPNTSESVQMWFYLTD